MREVHGFGCVLAGRARALVLAGLVCALVLGAGPAAAQGARESASELALSDETRAAVRKLADAGVAAYRAGDAALASEKLEKAYRLMPVPSLALWSARALVGRGAWTQAAERYLGARRLALGPGDPEIQLQAQQVAAAERAALMPRIPSLRVQVDAATPAEVAVSVDDAALPPLLVGEDWPVNPGSHVVVGRLGSERVEVAASVSEGEHAEVALRFVTPASVAVAPPASVMVAPSTSAADAREASLAPGSGAAAPPRADRVAPGSAWRTAGWVTLGVGGAVLAASGVVGLVARGRHRELTSSEDCLDGRCLAATRGDEVESYNRLVDLSTVGWIAGAALLGAGTVFVLAPLGEDSSTHVAVTPSAIELVGRF